MYRPHYSPIYEHWAPAIARIFSGFVFLMSAYFKIPGSESFAMQVEMSANAGIPLAYLAVLAAFVLEIVAGVALIVGWHARTAAFLLAGFVFLIAIFFYRDISNQMTFAMFMSCLVQIAGLIYISVYGARSVAIRRDRKPDL